MFALIQGLVTPEMGHWVRSGEYVFIAELGGTLHPVGAFFGALAFEFFKLYAAQALTGAWQLVMGTVLLIFKDVSVDIAGIPVLRRLSVAIQPGAIFAMVGRNGAGKTTLLRTIMGLCPLRGGHVTGGRGLAGRACFPVRGARHWLCPGRPRAVPHHDRAGKLEAAV